MTYAFEPKLLFLISGKNVFSIVETRLIASLPAEGKNVFFGNQVMIISNA